MCQIWCLFALSFNNECHVLCMNAKTFGQFARRINFYNTTSFLILSFSIEIAHCDKKRIERYQSQCVEIIREIGRSLKKRPVPDFTFRGIRFACKSVWIRIRAHSHDYIGANSYCPSRDFQAWKVAVLRGKEKEKYTYYSKFFNIF